MADDFDPYHRWLGIAPDHRPADHYQLLGIPRFESDPEVIASSADRQMAHVRSFQSGRHMDLTQRVLNELAAARACLLSVEQKAKYDARLRTVYGPANALPGPPPGAKTPPAVASPTGSSTASSPPKITVQTTAKPPRRVRVGRPSQLVWIGMIAGIVLGVGCTVSVVLLLAPQYGKLVIEMGSADRQSSKLEIDGVPREVPAKGPIEFALVRGTHEIVVVRPAHSRYEKTVEIEPRAAESLKIQLRPLARLTIEFTGRRPENIRLSIDGEAQAIPAGRSFVVPCEPGTHLIRAESARGKFERSVTVLPEQNFRVPVTILTDNRLVGRWNGTIEIDQAAVERRLAQTRANPLMRALLQPTLEALRVGGTLDLTLRADGTYELTTKLGPLASSAVGQWGVTEELATRVTVELTPAQGDVEYRQFHFDGKDSFRTDLPKELSGLGHFRCRRGTSP